MFRHLEDLAVGERMITASVHLTEAEMISFASQYDPQPMHTDPEAAARGPYAGIIASGWHTAAVVMRLIAEARPLGQTEVLGLGVDDLRWPRPLRPPATIHAEMEIVSITPSRSKPDFGIVRTHTTAHDAHGEIVMSMFTILWVPRRRAESHGSKSA